MSTCGNLQWCVSECRVVFISVSQSARLDKKKTLSECASPVL